MSTFQTDDKKLKSIIISGDLHYRFKIFCKGKSLKIGAVIEDLMALYLHDSKTLQKMIDEEKEKSII
jgi:hypothetical protein